MEKGLVSIITPCYNGEKYLDRYFQSIINQTYRPLELIFVNDGSTDKTEEIVNKYREQLEKENIKFIYLYQENAGQAAALNKGLKIFTGEYLTWPDSDDEMLPTCIEKKVEFLNKNTDIELCICKVQKIDEDSRNIIGIEERKKPEKETLFEDLIFIKNVFFIPGGYMIRGNVVDEEIKDREIYSGPGGQNCQLLLPIAYRNKIGYLDDVLYNYYVRKESHSHSIKTAEQIICQLKYYVMILVETIKKMNIDDGDYFIKQLKKYYSHQIFGNAIDSKNKTLIKEGFQCLKENKVMTLKEFLLYIKYYILKNKRIG